MSNVVVVQAGLSQVITAGGIDSRGPYFPIRYFLLVYDPRIDPNIHTIGEGASTDVQEFSATSLSGDASAIQTGGNYIFNISGKVKHHYIIKFLSYRLIVASFHK